MQLSFLLGHSNDSEASVGLFIEGIFIMRCLTSLEYGDCLLAAYIVLSSLICQIKGTHDKA